MEIFYFEGMKALHQICVSEFLQVLCIEI